MSEEGKVPLPNLEDGASGDRRARWRRSRRDRRRASPAISKRYSTFRSRSRRCSAGRGWRSAICLSSAPARVLELDRKVGEAIDIYVNNRLVARGEVVLVEEKLGVTMTEIIKAERVVMPHGE